MPDRARFERDLRVIKETLATDPDGCRAALRWYEAERQRRNDCFIWSMYWRIRCPTGCCDCCDESP